MTSTLLIAVEIALLGMMIVFAAILLIWLIISLITKIGSIQKNGPDQDQESIRMQKAAAVAVAEALLNQERKNGARYKLPPTAIVSAWQLSMRTNQMKKSRKKG